MIFQGLSMLRAWWSSSASGHPCLCGGCSGQGRCVPLALVVLWCLFRQIGVPSLLRGTPDFPLLDSDLALLDTVEVLDLGLACVRQPLLDGGPSGTP